MANAVKFKQANVSDLVPYASNSRTHSDEQIEQIAKSIQEFGFLNPVIIDSKNGIIAGHGRVMACEKLGIKKVPCILAEHLTDDQVRAYVIADNQLALNAGWDFDVLKTEIEGLQDAGFDVDLLGFDGVFLDIISEGNEVKSLNDEWDGMPEFQQDSHAPFRSVIVHFHSDQDIEEFKKLIGQDFSVKAKYIYHPKQEREDLESLRYE